MTSRYSKTLLPGYCFKLGNNVCVRVSPMVPLVGNICTIGTNLFTNGTIGKEIGANGKNGNAIGTNGTNVTNQWYIGSTPNSRIVIKINKTVSVVDTLLQNFIHITYKTEDLFY